MIRVQDLALTLKEDEKVLKDKISKKLRIAPKDIVSYRIFKKAIDARKKHDIKLVYTVDVETTKEKELLKKFPNMKAPDLSYHYPTPGNEPLKHRPVVVGSGP